jgi:hypothetical protein
MGSGKDNSAPALATFRAAFVEELKSLGEDEPPDVAFAGTLGEPSGHDAQDPGSEPYAVRVPRDLAGLALSGGGIRSATFNLGLLQGLADRDVLRHFDYLSTVSGGGYVGGFWSAWRARHGANATASAPSMAVPETERPAAAARIEGSSAVPLRPAVPFPTETTAHDELVRAEPEPVRHLREFSRFLAPRWGLFELETWQFFGGAVTAMLPTIFVGLSILTILVWYMLIISGEAVGGLDLAAQSIPYLGWIRHVDLTMLIVGAAMMVVLVVYERQTGTIERRPGEPYYFGLYVIASFLAAGIALTIVWQIVGGFPNWEYFEVFPGFGGAHELRLRFSAPALGWLSAMAVLIVLRTIPSRWITDPRQGFYRTSIDRVIARLLGLAFFWLAMMTFVLGSYAVWRAAQSLVWTAGAGGMATLLYSWIQRLLAREPNRAKNGFLGKVLQRYALPLLALVALIAFALAAACLVYSDIGQHSYLSLLIALGIVVVAAFLYNPNEIGMHALYRTRLARSYLGASNPKAPRAADNRQSTQRPDDDILMSDLPRRPPLHLVCCTANDLAGNHLANLSRGGRSAALSPFGITLGNRYQRWQDATAQVSLASAMTASAAAFNSNMGSVSMDVGPAAAFLLAAFDLRLGYWYRFSPSKWLRLVPGLDFLFEMFGRTTSGPDSQSIHLSDGGHFENLGLYELLRRRCKYIVVSDCGADPEVNFDDVGNALRRAREDFGVEIEVDLGVLKPDEKRYSRQHVAVGDILYPDGDRGILLLFKPTLVGDEPGDVLQYKSRNDQFPHESTGDQFYDEKQWESYRRLGLHAARVAFAFLGDEGAADRSASETFGEARWEWLPVPTDLEQQLLSRTDQLERLEQQLVGVDVSLMRDLAPEMPWKANEPKRTDDMTAEELAKIAPLFTQVMQLMEDVYVSCDMKSFATHPLNLGWLNAFGRWTTTPAFHDFWPFFAPMYNPQMTRFMEGRFNLPSTRQSTAEVRLVTLAKPAGVAFEIWKSMYPDETPRGNSCRSYEVKCGNRYVSAGLLFATERDGVLVWNDEDLFIPPSFWGAGMGTGLLTALVKSEPTCQVNIADAPSRRKEVSAVTQMYRQAGFIRAAGSSRQHVVMTRGVAPKPAA